MAGTTKGPAGLEPRGPSFVSADVRAAPVPGSGAGGLRRWLCGLDLGRTGGGVNAVACAGTWGLLRIVLDGGGIRNHLTRHWCIFAVFRRSAPGVPGADRSLG